MTSTSDDIESGPFLEIAVEFPTQRAARDRLAVITNSSMQGWVWSANTQGSSGDEVFFSFMNKKGKSVSVPAFLHASTGSVGKGHIWLQIRQGYLADFTGTTAIEMCQGCDASSKKFFCFMISTARRLTGGAGDVGCYFGSEVFGADYKKSKGKIAIQRVIAASVGLSTDSDDVSYYSWRRATEVCGVDHAQ